MNLFVISSARSAHFAKRFVCQQHSLNYTMSIYTVHRYFQTIWTKSKINTQQKTETLATRNSVISSKMSTVDYCKPLTSKCCFHHIYSTVTLNFDLLTPKYETFVSVPKCIDVTMLQVWRKFRRTLITLLTTFKLF